MSGARRLRQGQQRRQNTVRQLDGMDNRDGERTLRRGMVGAGDTGDPLPGG
jgi:hypothetical protein